MEILAILSVGAPAVCGLFLLCGVTGPWRRDPVRAHAAALRLARRELGLTASQLLLLETVLQHQADDVSRLSGGNPLLRDALAQAVSGPALGREALNELFAEKRGQVERAYVLARDRFLLFHAGLSPAQQARLAGLVRRGRAGDLLQRALVP